MLVLYPGYRFETLLTDLSATEAQEILAAWLAAFHPALIEQSGDIPHWESASTPPYVTGDATIVIPPCCEAALSEEWFSQQQDRRLIRGFSQQNDIVTAVLEQEGLWNHGLGDDFVARFQALGLAHFLTEMLVYRLQYTSVMEDAQLASLLVEAIRSYRRGDQDTAFLKQAYDVICQAKEYFYSVPNYYLDLTLVTETTLDGSLRRLLDASDSVNLFLPSRVLAELPEKAPEIYAKLQLVTATGKVQFVADDTETKSLALLPILEMADRVLEGISVFREKLHVSPTIFGRLTAGLNPLLPQILKLAGIRGVVLFAPLAGKQFKEETQSKIIWQGADGTKLDALVRYPLDASKASEFFQFADRLAETMHSDHAPTTVFASFPNILQNSETINWLTLLHHLDLFSCENGFGNFTGIEKYFDDTARCGGVHAWNVDRFPDIDVLTQSVLAGDDDPISLWNRIHLNNARRHAESAFQTGTDLLKRKVSDDQAAENDANDSAAKRFVDAVTECSKSNNHSTDGIFVTNPWSFPRRVFLDVSEWPRLPAENEQVVLARSNRDKKEIVVDVPPSGYIFIETDSHAPNSETHRETKQSRSLLGRVKKLIPRRLRAAFRSAAQSEPSLIRKSEDDLGRGVRRSIFLLQNEFFEAKIDSETGMLRSIFTENARFNRLSRQVACRMPKERRTDDPRNTQDPNRGYAVSVADEIAIQQAGPVTGTLQIQGRLIDPADVTVARFTEIVSIKRKSRLLEFDLTLDPVSEFETETNPWDSYFGIRYAWNDDTLELRGCRGDGLFPLDRERLQSPRVVDLRGEKSSLTFFSEGLPFHRRVGERTLDTIIVAGKEKARKFRTGIGVDIPHPLRTSLEFLAPKEEFVVSAPAPARHFSSSFFQIDANNVVALYWESVANNENAVIGFHVFLLETEGRRAHFSLHSLWPLQKACKTDLFGETLKEFSVKDHCVLIDMRGHELLPLTVLLEQPRDARQAYVAGKNTVGLN